MSKKFVASERPEGAPTMDIAQLKEMNISSLTQIAKDLNIQGIDLTARTMDLDVESMRVMQGQRIAMIIDADRKKKEYESFRDIPRDKRLSVVNSELIRDSNILQLGQAYLLADQRVTQLQTVKCAFDIDMERCVCGGKLKFIAVIEQPDVIEKILKHLGLDP